MQFYFTKTDSIYKIFTTLEKVSNGREVEIFIESEHSLFDNPWRGKQLKELVDNKHLKAVFSTKNRNIKDYYQNLNLETNVIKERKIQEIFSILRLFFFDIKKFHLHAYKGEKYLFGLIIGFEIVLGGLLVWLIVSLVAPSATINIKPSTDKEDIIYNFRYYPAQEGESQQDSRYLSIPYYTGQINYQYDLMISVNNIEYLINPAKGKIKIYNKIPQNFTFLGNTRFVTDNGLIFRATQPFEITTGSEQNPSVTIITVQADDIDEIGQIIGIRGNIATGTSLWIKNMDESIFFKEIWAESINDFNGGSTSSAGTITTKDIAQLTGKLIEQIYQQKLDIVGKNFGIDGAVVLPFDSLTSTTFNLLTGDRQLGEVSPTVKGTAFVTFTFHYIYFKDLLHQISTYLKERGSDQKQISEPDSSSLQFLTDTSSSEPGDFRKNGTIYIIPTKVTIFQGYDFLTDTNQILDSLKNKIAGKSVDEARNYILSNYNEVGSVQISIKPFRYDSIPNIKSRIHLQAK